MLMNVGEFCDRVESNVNGLIADLVQITGRTGDAERRAWQRSLPKLSVLLNHADLADFHLKLGQSGGVSVEYQLPISSAWCDAVLLGRGNEQPAAVMIELKDWDVTGDQAARRPGLVRRQGVDYSHPSDQVRGYVEYCRHFHSTVLEENAAVSGCVFFTSARDVDLYRNPPYRELVEEFPVFDNSTQSLTEAMPEYLSHRLKQPDYGFAQRFELGIYAQDRSLVRHVADSVLSDSSAFYVLLDEQRKGYEVCLEEIEELLAADGDPVKAVIIISGPPGSGKSVLAAKLWATLALDLRVKGNVVMTSTSSSQRTNWQAMFRRKAGHRAASGMIVPANKYNPGLSPTWVNEAREMGYALDIADWRDNVELYLREGGQNKMPDDKMWVSVVDEAHALIDPTAENKRGIPPSGWSLHAGPQAWHIMRASRVSVFLMDGEQSYRDNETTTPDQIEDWAEELGITRVKRVDLGDAQFRCGGSKEYIEWLECALGLSRCSPPNTGWRRNATNGTGSFTFELVQDPAALDEKLLPHIRTGRTARLLASYSRPWVTKGVGRPHDLPPEEQDFCIPYSRNRQRLTWSRIWNYAPGQDYELFVQAPPGTRMHDNPLAEVGCPYVVRGFDYDYVGVLWLGDLVWRQDHWQVVPDQVYESALPITLANARKEGRRGVTGSATEELLARVQRGYRILLSRAIYGVYLWVQDPETRAHVAELLA